MKTNKFVEELKNKSANELNEELVAAKKELFNLRFQNATNQFRQHIPDQRSSQEHRSYPDCYH